MIARGRQPRRWRPARSKAGRWTASEIELINALEIVELLASHPHGLTIPEIVSSLQKPAARVVHTIAILQQRKWLRPNAQNVWVVDAHVGLSSIVPEA